MKSIEGLPDGSHFFPLAANLFPDALHGIDEVVVADGLEQIIERLLRYGLLRIFEVGIAGQ
ncbi:hypothetical protein D3C84_758170 [compost metagenome]